MKFYALQQAKFREGVDTTPSTFYCLLRAFKQGPFTDGPAKQNGAGTLTVSISAMMQACSWLKIRHMADQVAMHVNSAAVVAGLWKAASSHTWGLWRHPQPPRPQQLLKAECMSRSQSVGDGSSHGWVERYWLRLMATTNGLCQ